MTAPFVFESKAATLARLEDQLTTARVLPQTTIEAEAWRNDPQAEARRVLALPWARRRPGQAAGPALIVRSCAAGEDAEDHSLAGRFTSVGDVLDDDGLCAAVDAVFASYGAVGASGPVLVQPMLERPVASGVVTSCEIGSGRPYIVVNTSHGPDTTAVTGGRSNRTEVFYHFRGALEAPSGREGAVIRMLREVEARTGLSRLDLEFAFVEGEALPVLLQARPLVGATPAAAPRDRHCRRLATAEAKARSVLGAHPLARGRRSALGCMTDWNPAEMIGMRPKPLALSLYRALVTDTVWSSQRAAYGYRDLGGFPLLIDVLGVPYVDIRASFESFLPAALPDAAAGRLVDHYLDRLAAAPALHDKVEFEIVLSCYAFDIEGRLEVLRRAGIAEADITALRAALHALTLRILDDGASPRLADLAALEQLQRRYRILQAANLPPLSSAYWLLQDCRRFGTSPFAGLARVGFIAMELLNSLVTVGAITDADRRAFLMSVATIASEMQEDLQQLPRPAFLARFGHLRPGAYDISSPRYDEAPDLYFGPAPTASSDQRLRASADVAAAQAARDRLAERVAPLLAAHNLGCAPRALVDFIAAGIRDREWAKFLFTRNLSDALAKLTAWGADVGLSAGELAYADVRAVDQAYGSARPPVEIFCETIRTGREAHRFTAATCLPPVIVDAREVWSFALPAATPNFVTNLAAQGPVVADLDRARLAGAIVLIPSADPGFDWVFSYAIAGLVTAYGGANSHMAIRAAELDLPAVIGCGERLFSEWARAPGLRIDCANRRVDPLPR